MVEAGQQEGLKMRVEVKPVSMRGLAGGQGWSAEGAVEAGGNIGWPVGGVCRGLWRSRLASRKGL